MVSNYVKKLIVEADYYHRMMIAKSIDNEVRSRR